MVIRNTALSFLITAASVPAALAGNFVGGELGYQENPAFTTAPREQVRSELDEFRAHPVSSDGTVMLGGEAGVVSRSEGAYADRQPGGAHTHVLGNTGASASPAAAPPFQTEYRRHDDR